jgi:hypothetical protein
VGQSDSQTVGSGTVLEREERSTFNFQQCIECGDTQGSRSDAGAGLGVVANATGGEWTDWFEKDFAANDSVMP